MQALDYISADSVREVVGLLISNNGKARILAGGTDLLVQLRENRRKAGLLIDVKNIAELRTIHYDPQAGLWIGAAASCFEICHNKTVSETYPGLIDAVRLIGGVQIQNRASLGGNLCNASPAADSIPALIVHDATCILASADGTRKVPVEDFCTAPGKTALEHGELLVAVSIPPPKENFGAHYLRFIPRNEENIREAAAIAQAVARPISDLRGTAEHRKHLCEVLTRRALEKAIERARIS